MEHQPKNKQATATAQPIQTRHSHKAVKTALGKLTKMYAHHQSYQMEVKIIGTEQTLPSKSGKPRFVYQFQTILPKQDDTEIEAPIISVNNADKAKDVVTTSVPNKETNFLLNPKMDSNNELLRMNTPMFGSVKNRNSSLKLTENAFEENKEEFIDYDDFEKQIKLNEYGTEMFSSKQSDISPKSFLFFGQSTDNVLKMFKSKKVKKMENKSKSFNKIIFPGNVASYNKNLSTQMSYTPRDSSSGVEQKGKMPNLLTKQYSVNSIRSRSYNKYNVMQ